MASDENLVFIVLSNKEKGMFWVKCLLQSKIRVAEFHLLLEKSKLYDGRFRMQFRMLVAQFVKYDFSLVCQKMLVVGRHRL